MKFVKLHDDGREMLVNMNAVTEVYKVDDDKCVLYLNLAENGEQIHFTVDETLDEIFEKIKESE